MFFSLSWDGMRYMTNAWQRLMGTSLETVLGTLPAFQEEDAKLRLPRTF